MTTAAKSEAEAGYRTYEVYQRERVSEPKPAIKPGALRSSAYLHDPYPLLAQVREAEPCHRDWGGNCFWVTRYDDVTSVFVDDANFATRPKLVAYGMEGWGRDLRGELAVLARHAEATDRQAPVVAERILRELAPAGEADLALGFAARFAVELLAAVTGVPDDQVPAFTDAFLRAQRGARWEPQAQQAGRVALQELATMLRVLMEQRRADPQEDVLSALSALGARPEDAVVTLLEADSETLHGALANLWFLLLTSPDQLEWVSAERRMVKVAYLEAVRHSTPVLTAKRWARHEVERFGRLLPEGALVMCSAAAANRDPRVFREPDAFLVGRKDLCQREPRGQYRADGLPTGMLPGLGPPSKHPALPEDRPRSLYALTRDTVVTVSNLVLDALPGLALAPAAKPELRALRVDEVHTCWHLPVTFRAS